MKFTKLTEREGEKIFRGAEYVAQNVNPELMDTKGDEVRDNITRSLAIELDRPTNIIDRTLRGMLADLWPAR